jgi:prevent-host-death family protein
MKIASITDVRQDATNLIAHARTSHEPVLVMQRSKPAAYLVAADEYEQLQAEVRQLRHELFWQDAAEASAEYAAGKARRYDDAHTLVADLNLTGEQ